MEVVVVLALALFILFPLYTLVRLAVLGGEVAELKRQLTRLQRTAPDGTPALQSLAQSLDAGLGIPPVHRPVSPQRQDTAPDFIVEPVPVASLVPTPAPPIQPGSSGMPPLVAPAAIPRIQPRPVTAAASTPLDIESMLGANWMAKLGIAAIAVSAAFFLQYAFRNGWIKPWGQVGIGLCGAVVMMAAGQLLLAKERFRTYAQVLFSGGIVVYFLSIYAAYHFYSPPLMGYWPAFGAFVVGAVAASALAFANKTEVVAVICVLGAFAAPALIREQAGATVGDSLIRLYVYLAVINLWAAGFIRFRGWHSVAVVSFMCTWILFFAAGPIAHGGWRTEFFAVLFFLSAVWAGVTALYNRANSSDIKSLRLVGNGIVAAGCAAFVAASAAILADLATFGVPDLALAGSMAALLLGGLAALAPVDEGADTGTRTVFACLSAILSGVVMLLAFGDAPAVPGNQVGTAFGFAVLNYDIFFAMSFYLRKRGVGEGPAALMLGANAATHILAVLHVLAHSQVAGVPAVCLWLPMIASLSLGGVWYAAEGERAPMTAPAVLAVAAQAFVLTALLRAVGPLDGPFVAHWPATAIWMLAAEFALLSSAWIALRDRLAWPDLRMDVAGTLGNAAMFFCLFAWALGGQKTAGISMLAVCATAMAAWYGLLGGMALSGEDEDPLLRYTHLGLAVTFTTIAIPLQLEAAWVTVAWAVEAAAIVWAGFGARSATMRVFGCVVIAIAACRAFAIDLLREPGAFHVLFNERSLAGAAVIAAAYVSAWLVWASRDESDNSEDFEASVPPGLLVLANACTLAFVSRDLWQQFGGQDTGVVSAQQLALSIFWAFYGLAAICVGIWMRQRMVRLFAMDLLYVSIFKVFLYDLRQLETPYRIASFFTLGMVFLLVSYLYTRFEERMRGDGEAPVAASPPKAPGSPHAPGPPRPGVAT